MESLIWRLRISALWLFFAVNMVGGEVFELMEPGRIEGMMAGEMEGMQISTGLLMFLALFMMLIPLTMAFLSLILKYSANRWANFVLGIIYAALMLFDVIRYLSRGELGGYTLPDLAGIVVPALIAWYAWKLPKEEA